MLINAANLQALRVGFKTDFQGAFDAVPKMKDRVAKTVTSTTASNAYGWLKTLTGMREWLGNRVVDSLSEASYTIVNKSFEKTIGVNRDNIEDDNLGMYKDGFTMMGDGAGRLPEELVWGLLKAGFSTNCWDGQYFFDTDHPVLLPDGTMGTYANTDGGAGQPWFLMCSKRPIKPIIYQERKAPNFVAKDKENDDNVFDRKEYLYGVDMRCNVGYGLPQLAWGSKQTLNAANYEIARSAIINMKADGGGPLGLIPDLLVVGATNRLVDVDPETLTDMQRAARFLFLQRLAFGGKVSGKNFGLSTDRPSRFNLTTLEPDLEALHSRLSGVTVTCMDFADFIRRVDRPETLFYLDPPYWGCEGDYGKALFSRERFEELATVLGALKGRFILSLNDVEGVRETFKAFRFREVKTTYTIAAKGAAPERAEVLISNYELGGL